MITSFNTQLFDISMNSATLANTVGANGQISYNYETGKLYVHDGFGGKSANTLVQAVFSWSFQGSSYGYSTGGLTPGGTTQDVIQRFSLTSDGSATDVGEMLAARDQHGSSSSATHAFTFGYSTGNPFATSSSLESFPFANESTSTSVATFTFPAAPTNALLGSRQSSHTRDRGYLVGGYLGGTSNLHDISYYNHSSYAFSAEAASLTIVGVWGASGSSSDTYGYKHGGNYGPVSRTNIIQKFPFSSDSNSTNVGNLIHSKSYHGAASSTEHAFVFGGTAPNTNDIQKYSFSSDSNAIDTTGGLVFSGNSQGGVSGTTNGYSVGGNNGSGTVEKFPYAISSGSTTTSDLATSTWRNGGHQI